MWVPQEFPILPDLAVIVFVATWTLKTLRQSAPTSRLFLAAADQ